jgi:hypothetical protein
MVNLRQSDLRLHENLLHGSRMCHSIVGITVERLDQDPRTSLDESRCDEGSCVRYRQEARLYSDSSFDQCVAQLDDSRLSLIGRHQLGQDGPT